MKKWIVFIYAISLLETIYKEQNMLDLPKLLNYDVHWGTRFILSHNTFANPLNISPTLQLLSAITHTEPYTENMEFFIGGILTLIWSHLL